MHSRRRTSKGRWGRQYKAFRRKLVEARLLADLTQEEAGEKVGRSQSFVAKSETGERRVDIVELVQFARAYKKPLSYFAPFFKGG